MFVPIGARHNASHHHRLVGVRDGLRKAGSRSGRVQHGVATASRDLIACSGAPLDVQPSPGAEAQRDDQPLRGVPCVAAPPRDRGPSSKTVDTRVSQLEARASGRDLRRPPRSPLARSPSPGVTAGPKPFDLLQSRRARLRCARHAADERLVRLRKLATTRVPATGFIHQGIAAPRLLTPDLGGCFRTPPMSAPSPTMSQPVPSPPRHPRPRLPEPMLPPIPSSQDSYALVAVVCVAHRQRRRLRGHRHRGSLRSTRSPRSRTEVQIHRPRAGWRRLRTRRCASAVLLGV